MLRSRLILTLAAASAVFAASAAPASAAAPTFSKEIVRIFQNNCQNCHRTGVQFTPMGLMNYEEVRPWAKSIKKAVSERTMPPWHADPQYGHFSNDITMKQADIDAIVAWIDAGCPEGDKADLPTEKKFPDDNGWQIGQPDVIVDMGKDFTVAATGTIPYQYFVVKLDFPEDKWVSAMEARAGNLDVVHHAVIYLRNPKEGIQPPDNGGGLSGGLLGALSPGNTPSLYMPGEGKLIKKGASIVFNMHYTPCGKEVTDRSYVGFKFHKTPARKQVITRGIANMGFQIPPMAKLHEVKSMHRFDKDVTLISFMPHMHYRGKDFKYTVVYPDGKEEVLLSVPRYDFDWQVYYYLTERKKLPAGSKIECVAHYDNTVEMAEGRENFDPNKPVKFGEQSWEEMMIGWLDYTVDAENLEAPVGDAAPATKDKEVSQN